MGRVRCAVVSIGNPIKSDDNIANLVLDEIEDLKGVECIRAELTPENFVKPLRQLKPHIVFFMDAIDFDGFPGEVRLFKLEDLEELRASTHSIPLTSIKRLFGTNATDIKIIGIQPKVIDFGLKISKELKANFENIVGKVERLVLL
jgi:hydrogenase 3 maturation protease